MAVSVPQPPSLTTHGQLTTQAKGKYDCRWRRRSFRWLRRKTAFSLRLSIWWEKIPLEMVNAPSLDTFKRLLDLALPFMFPSLLWLSCSFNLHFTWFEMSLSVTEAAIILVGVGRPKVRSRHPSRLQIRLGGPGPSQYRSMAPPGSSDVGHRPGVR